MNCAIADQDHASPGRLGLLNYITLLSSSLKTLVFVFEPRNLHSSDALDASEDGGTVFYPWIATAISRARTHTALRGVRLRLQLPESGWPCAAISRYGFLDMLVTRELEDALCDIPNLTELAVELPAGPGDPPDAGRWWETELRKRFLRLNHKAQILAEVYPMSGAPDSRSSPLMA